MTSLEEATVDLPFGMCPKHCGAHGCVFFEPCSQGRLGISGAFCTHSKRGGGAGDVVADPLHGASGEGRARTCETRLFLEGAFSLLRFLAPLFQIFSPEKVPEIAESEGSVSS